jgi:hypothetical protein
MSDLKKADEACFTYFPPASQTPLHVPGCPECKKPLVPMFACSDSANCCSAWDVDDPRITNVPPAIEPDPTPVSKTEINTFAEHLATGIDGFSNFTGKARIIDWIRDQADSWATPVSTARTDGWVSVEERVPTGHETVLVATETGMIAVGWYHVTRKLWYKTHTVNGNHPEQFVTHWQPLPAAPGSVPQAEPPK